MESPWSWCRQQRGSWVGTTDEAKLSTFVEDLIKSKRNQSEASDCNLRRLTQRELLDSWRLFFFTLFEFGK